MNEYLYRVTLEPTDVWSKWNSKTFKPIYVVMSSIVTARKYAEDKIDSGLKVKRITLLGEKWGGCLFGTSTKK